ncbi:MAG TPA: hypothetical protein VMT76_09620 [Puia sp.]|nr:hypothetical protein [Puia sp.]
MRNFLVCILAFCITQACLAQNKDSTGRVFKKFKVDLAIGYASPKSSSSGADYNGGALFAIEPKFAVIDPLSVGARIEAAVTGHVYKNTSSNSNNSNNSNGKANLSYLLTADYYFTKTKLRPFIGAGGGIYTTGILDSNTVNSNSRSVPTTSQFGFMARAGIEVGHFRLGIEYNFAANDAAYLGLKIGAYIGGGRKNK